MKPSHHSIQTNPLQNQQNESLGTIIQQNNTQVNEINTQSQAVIIKVKNYQWTDQQNRKYYHFLIKLKEKHFATNPQAKIKKINVQMSNYIQTRTYLQCRSHNQKMLDRFGSIDNIITHFIVYFQRKDGVLGTIQAKQTNLHEQVRENTLQYQAGTRGKAQTIWPLTSWDLKYSLNKQQPYFPHQNQNLI